MKTLLVIGGFGFIATNILKFIDKYEESPYDVIVFDRFPHHLKGITFKCVKFVYNGDFQDNTIIEKIFKSHKVDIVLHCLSNTVPATSQNARFDD